jgi:hypothetical protein
LRKEERRKIGEIEKRRKKVGEIKKSYKRGRCEGKRKEEK